MRVVSLEAENVMGLRAVEIWPKGNAVVIGGKNHQGKSSILDAIWIALEGKTVGPPMLIRAGEERAAIRLNMGELIVTRRFSNKDGKFTESLRVEDPEGRIYQKPQAVLNALLGAIGFDPFEFVKMAADKQADTLREMVPLPIDLDVFAREDLRDTTRRRDINRDAKALQAQADAIIVPEMLPDAADVSALVDELSNAGQKNADRDREERRRTDRANDAEATAGLARKRRADAEALRSQAKVLDDKAAEDDARAAEINGEIDGYEPLPDPVDTLELRERIRQGEVANRLIALAEQRKAIMARVASAEADSAALTKALEDRDAQRVKALAEAKMPIAGLSFAPGPDGKQRVHFNGIPFEQISSEEQLRASTAIAMAANPTLRVLRVKDGSLLDDDAMKLLLSMADDEDWQLWIEKVGTGGVGFIVEDGRVREVEQPDTVDADKAEVEKIDRAAKRDLKAAKKAEGGLL